MGASLELQGEAYLPDIPEANAARIALRDYLANETDYTEEFEEKVWFVEIELTTHSSFTYIHNLVELLKALGPYVTKPALFLWNIDGNDERMWLGTPEQIRECEALDTLEQLWYYWHKLLGDHSGDTFMAGYLTETTPREIALDWLKERDLA